MAAPKKALKKRDIVNRTGGVETADGRTLYGFDAETYVRLQGKEDPNWHLAVAEWLELVVGAPLINKNDLWESLKDGIFLCRVMNALKPNSIPKVNQLKLGKLHPLMERENITKYIETCFKMAVPSARLFVITDLHKKENMGAVMANIKALSEIAHRFGCQVEPIPEKIVRVAKTDKKIWELEAETAGKVLAEESDEEVDKLDKDIQETTKKFEELKNKVRSMAGKLTRESNQMKLVEKQVMETRKDIVMLRSKGKGGNHADIDRLTQAVWDAREQIDVTQDNIDFPNPESEEAKLQKAIQDLAEQAEKERKKGDKEILKTQQDHDSKMAGYNEQIEGLSERANEVIGSLAVLKEQLHGFDQKKRDIDRQKQQIESRLQELDKEHAAKVESFKQLTHDVANQVQEVVKQKAKIEADMASQLKQYTAEEDQKRKVLEARQDAAEKEFKALRAQLQQEMAVETKELREQIDSQKSIVNGLERELHESKKIMTEATASLAKKVSQLEGEIERMNLETDTHIANLSEQIKNVYQQTKTSGQERQTKLDALTLVKNTQMNEQKAATKELEGKIAQELEIGEKELLQVSASLKGLQEKSEQSHRENEESNHKLATDLQAARDKFSDQSTQMTGSIATAKKEREAIHKLNQNERASLQAKLDQAKGQLKSFQESMRSKLKATEKEKSDLEASRIADSRKQQIENNDAVASLQQKIDEQQELIHQLETNIQNVEQGSDEMLVQLTQKHAQEQQQIKEQESELASLSNLNEKLKHEQREKFSNLEAETSALDQELREMSEKAHQETQELLAQSETHKAEILAQIEEIQTETAQKVADLQQEYLDLETVQMDLDTEHQEQVKLLTEELTQTKQRLDDEISNLFDSVAKEERYISDLLGGDHEMNELNEGEIALLKMNIDNLNESIDTQISEFTRQVEETQKANELKIIQTEEELELQREIYQAQLQSLISQQNGLIEELSGGQSNFEERHSRLEKEKEELSQQVIDFGEERSNRENELLDRQDKFDNESKEVSDSLNALIAESNKELESLGVEQQRINLKIAAIRTSIQHANEEFEDQQNSLKNQHQTLTNNFQKLQQRIQEKETESTTLEANITGLEAELDTKQATVSDLQMELLEKETQHEVIESKIVKIEEKTAKTLADLALIKSENRKLKEIYSQHLERLEQSRAQFKEDMDKTLQTFMRTSADVDIPGLISQFKDAFNDDENRREFTALLDSYAERPNHGSYFLIPQRSVPGVGVLTGLVLGGLDLKSGGLADFLTAKLLLEMSNKLKFIEEGQEIFFTALIKNHRCWDNFKFWTDLFLERIPGWFIEKYVESSTDAGYSSEAITALAKRILAFSQSMTGWGHLTANQIASCTLGATEGIIQELNLEIEKDELIRKVTAVLKPGSEKPERVRERVVSTKSLPQRPTGSLALNSPRLPMGGNPTTTNAGKALPSPATTPRGTASFPSRPTGSLTVDRASPSLKKKPPVPEKK